MHHHLSERFEIEMYTQTEQSLYEKVYFFVFLCLSERNSDYFHCSKEKCKFTREEIQKNRLMGYYSAQLWVEKQQS